MIPRPRPLPWLLALGLSGCDATPPAIDSLPHAQDSQLSWVESIPAMADGSPPPVAQLIVHSASALDARTAILVTGELSDVAMKALREGLPPSSLASRTVPTRQIAMSDGSLRVIPSRPLDAGKPHTLAVASARLRYRFAPSAEPLPLLHRIWPQSPARSDALIVLCGEAPLPPGLSLAGSTQGAPFMLSPGAPGAPTLARCITLTRTTSSAEAPLPPALMLDGVPLALLDPSPIERADDEPLPAAQPCPQGTLVLGAICLLPGDDRVKLLPGSSPTLTSLDAPKGPEVQVLSTLPVTVRGFTPSSLVSLTLTLIDASGERSTERATFSTLAPEPHLVINEVLADPLGPEPRAEWVELYNDGLTPVDLVGWSFGDPDLSAVLDTAIVEPGEHVLLVNEGFTSDADVAPAPGTQLITVRPLGKNGLSNQGEALFLRRPDGSLASKFPPRPKPVAGVSVIRTRPDADDDDASAFTLAPGGKPTPGAENQ